MSQASNKITLSNKLIQQNEMNLVWVDMEMTGLDPNNDYIIEIATIVTDYNLNLLEEGPVIVIFQKKEILDNMDNWNKGTHSRSGLIEKVKKSKISVELAEKMTLEFLKQYVPPKKSPMCGSSICQDRRFMAKFMPNLESYFHYRNLDVSTLKELCKRWNPNLVDGFKKHQLHTALADIRESIEELKYYRKHFIKN